ncbi:MAG TPA: sugar ABC transporter permease [Chloroflexota bacterium]|nr:sugar ABC transporter permease [Chloroflexota bacterium]
MRPSPSSVAGGPHTGALAPARPTRLARRGRLWIAIFPYLLVSPVILYEGVLIVVPIIQGILTSFTRTELAGLPPRFVGLANYIRLLTDPDMGTVAFATLFLTLASVVIALSVALGVAVLLHHPFRGRALIRTLIILPWAVPDLPVLMIFNWMLNPVFGVMNVFARLWPGVHENLQWLNEPDTARLAVIMIGSWKGYPFYCLVLLAALQGISEQLYEAARVDGANTWECFRHITVPSVLPTLVVLTLLALIFSIKGFSLVYLLTGGGPDLATETLVLHIYKTAFRFYDYSYGQTMGTVGLLASVALAAGFFSYDRRQGARGG